MIFTTILLKIILILNYYVDLLNYCDTDSLSYEIKSENVYEEFFKWKKLLNFSNY